MSEKIDEFLQPAQLNDPPYIWWIEEVDWHNDFLKIILRCDDTCVRASICIPFVLCVVIIGLTTKVDKLA